jgi:hypothetical protein
MHQWTEGDEIAALYLYKFGDRPGGPVVDDVAGVRGMSPDSLGKRIRNFRYLDTGAGLGHYAKQTAAIYREYSKLPEVELRTLAGLHRNAGARGARHVPGECQRL